MSGNFATLKSLSRPVLVTGHTGFKGAWLSLALKRMGIEVVGISLPAERDSLYLSLDQSIWSTQYFVDIRDRTNLSKKIEEVNPSFVFHLAAQALVLKSYQDPLETFETNVIGTANVLEATRYLDSVKGVVVATTDKVYKNANLGRKFLETDPLMGTDPYSASKVGTEAVVQAWQTLNAHEGRFLITSVRAGNVIGGGDMAQNRLLPDLIRGFSGGWTVSVRNPESTRPWQHVADPLFGYLLTAETMLQGNKTKSFNFGPAEKSLAVEEVVKIARRTWNGPTTVEMIQTEPKVYEAKLLELDAGLAKLELNWTPLFSQESAVESTVNWWQNVLSKECSATDASLRDLERYEL